MAPTSRQAARRLLLSQLLDAYERSRSFLRPPPWPRDVLVKLDPQTFPDAFAPDGREILAGLRAAAEDLERHRAVRLARAAGWGDGEPREIRLGPEELSTAYELGERDGYEPLRVGLFALEAHSARLSGSGAPWLDAFLARVARAAHAGDLSPLGMRVERFKREWRDLLQAMTAMAHLSSGVSGWERVVSETIFGDSKRLGELRTRVAELLLRADPRWDGVGPDDAQDLLEVYGVRRKPGVLVCAGAAELCIDGRAYRLEDFVPVAHLPEAWMDAWVEGLVGRVHVLTTIENEYPFLSYVEECGGPRGLGARGELAVYTGGFPTPSLVQALVDLCARVPEIVVRHWGDADLGGVRIWWHLRQRMHRAVQLFRSNASWLESKVGQRPGTPLKPLEQRGLEQLRRELDRGGQSQAPDILQALELLGTLLRLGMKVEQERF